MRITVPLFVIYSAAESRMPLFKARATPRSPVTEKAANGVQHRGNHHEHHHPHQAGGDNGHDSGASDNGTGSRSGIGAPPLQQEQMRPPPRDPKPSTLVFHCQLAHGSPTGLISDFGNVRELYQKIAERYDLPAEEVSARIAINAAEHRRVLFSPAERKDSTVRIEVLDLVNSLNRFFIAAMGSVAATYAAGHNTVSFPDFILF